MTAKIIDLPSRDDDTIPVITGIPFIDADPALIARRVGGKPWTDRIRFFNNIIDESFARTMNMHEYAASEDDAMEWLNWVYLKFHQRIGEVLDFWGEDEPGEDLAVLMFALSLKPAHRLAAREYFRNRSGPDPGRQFNEIAGDRAALCATYNGSELIRPGLAFAWKVGVPEKCDAMFRHPDDPSVVPGESDTPA